MRTYVVKYRTKVLGLDLSVKIHADSEVKAVIHVVNNWTVAAVIGVERVEE
jgi:hypothetical protein